MADAPATFDASKVAGPATFDPTKYTAPTMGKAPVMQKAVMGKAPEAPVYTPGGQAMQRAAEKSYGKSAADALRMAMGAATPLAQQQANIAAAGAGTQATGYARASGLSPAQAALMAGQQAGTNYNSAYGQNLAEGINQYGSLASAMGNLGLQQGQQALQKYGTDVQKYGTDVGANTSRYGTDVGANVAKYGADVGARSAKYGADVSRYGTDVGAGLTSSAQDLSRYQGQVNAGLQGSAQDMSKWATQLGNETQRYGIDQGVGQQNAQNWTNAIGTGISALAPLAAAVLSDENAKEDIKDGYGILARVTKVVNPKTFKYKEGTGMDANAPRVGVMAQDLEKTPLASTVKTGQDGLKRVDTGQLTLGNTAMISELSKKLDSVFDYIKKQGVTA